MFLAKHGQISRRKQVQFPEQFLVERIDGHPFSLQPRRTTTLNLAVRCFVNEHLDRFILLWM